MEAERRRKLAGERDAVRNRLWLIADGSEARDSDKLTALRMLGQQSGVDMFAERVEVSNVTTGSDAELVAELEDMLRNTLGVK